MDEALIIAGYFSVVGKETELWKGVFEEIAPTAFDDTLSNDIKALVNHDTTLVLGRNKANTLILKIDSRGLFATITINPKDSDAVNLYERVKRGDVDQCSFGFEILEETSDYRDDGTVKFTILKLRLHEVSVVTFPAYSDTSVQAREMQIEKHQIQLLERRKKLLKERLTNGA